MKRNDSIIPKKSDLARFKGRLTGRTVLRGAITADGVSDLARITGVEWTML